MNRVTTAVGLMLCALLVQAAPAAAQADVAGTWTVMIQSPQGAAEGEVVLAQDGSTVTGTMNIPEVGEVELTDGMIEGNTLTFDVDIMVQGMPILLEVEGTIDGNMVEGQMFVAEFGAIPFSGERTQ